MSALTIRKAYCVELGRVVNIAEARREFLNMATLVPRFTFLCQSKACADHRVVVIGVSYRVLAKDAPKHVTAHFRKHNEHCAGCDWIGPPKDKAGEVDGALQSRIVAPLFMDPSLANDGPRLRAFFTAAFDAMFAYLLEHQRLTRILFWEMASGWKTYVQLGSRLQSADLAPLEALFQRAHASGLIRSSFAPAVQLTIALQICHVYLASAPLYRMQQPLLEPRATEARRYLVELVVASIMSDAPAGAALPNC